MSYFFKVKAKYAVSINAVNRNVDASNEMPYLNGFINKHKIKVEKIEKSFISPKNKDLKNIIRLKISETQNLQKLLEDLKASGYFEYVEKVAVRKIIAMPNDTHYGSQWALAQIKAQEAWVENPGGAKCVVAVVDNAINTAHPDLAANSIAGYDMADNDTDTNPINDTFSHGTHVAGIVGAVTNNGLGVAAASNNKISVMPVKATSDLSDPDYIDYGFEGIVWAVDHGAKIINMSWGGTDYLNTEQAVCDYAYSNGVMLVAAAGNDANEDFSYPASYNHVISVASTDSTDKKSSYSSFNGKVDISAPGRKILSTIPTNVYAFYNGTSMASPMAASCLGYLCSCFPTLSIDQLEALLKSTSKNIDNLNPNYKGKLGSGRIDLLKAVACKNLGLDTLNLKTIGSKYFCNGDSIKISTSNISNTTYTWYKNDTLINGNANIYYAKSIGSYHVVATKGNCTLATVPVKIAPNTMQSPAPVIVPSPASFACSVFPDTLKMATSNCDYPNVYQQSYSGPTIGFDGGNKSGNYPAVTISNAAGIIDSLEVNIIWQKKRWRNLHQLW